MYINVKGGHSDCPYCKPKKTCPWCNPPYDPWRESQCVLNKPLMMVIPPGGCHLSCPVHPEGHHVFGSQVWCESQTWTGTKSNNEQWGSTAIGGPQRNDTWKFSM